MRPVSKRKLMNILLVLVGVFILFQMHTYSKMYFQTTEDNILLKILDMNESDLIDELPRVPANIHLLRSIREQIEAGSKLHKLIIEAPVEYKCEQIRYIKNVNEGGRDFCNDAQFAIKQPCLVYSFGINYDYTFDDAMGKLGCEVFSFDPSMNTSDHRRNPHVVFYQLGLGGDNTDTFTPKRSSRLDVKYKWKMRTLKSVMKMLKHLNRTIDLLKIDIEASEWPAVRSMLETGVTKQIRQILLEWHIFPEHPARMVYQLLIDILLDLKSAGFEVFSKLIHPHQLNWEDFNLQCDIGYVNINFTK